MRISEDTWIKYIGKLRKINNDAADKMALYLREHEFSSVAGKRAALDYAYALSTTYGEAATALTCEMYDAVAAASGVVLPAAEPAATATYSEVAKTVNGAFKQTESPDVVSQAVGRLVKQAGVDTTMKNAIRDGAEWAWIPHGDTCAFCITLASRGWQKASKAALKGNHAEHIHSNCDCTYAIRFGRDTTYAGYDPDKYLEAYENADGSKPQDKINALRRQHYAENKDRINEQKRIAYAKRMGLQSVPERVQTSAELTERRIQRAAEWRKRHAMPNFSQMDAGQLREYAENSLKTDFVGMNGANADYVREAVKVMSEFEQKMGGQTIDGLSVQFGGLPKGVYAKYDDKTNTLLLKRSGSITQFEESQRAANARYHVRWRTDRDYYATETYSGTIWHELGHAIDFCNGQSLSGRLSATSALDEACVRVSAYAGTSQNVRVTKRSEAWAENFAAYMDGGKNKGRVPPEIVRMIESLFNR